MLAGCDRAGSYVNPQFVLNNLHADINNNACTLGRWRPLGESSRGIKSVIILYRLLENL